LIQQGFAGVAAICRLQFFRWKTPISPRSTTARWLRQPSRPLLPLGTADGGARAHTSRGREICSGGFICPL